MLEAERPGVFCLESAAISQEPESSIGLLYDVTNLSGAPLRFKTISSIADLERQLNFWSMSTTRRGYPLLVLSGHGDPGEISFGKEKISILDIAELLDGKGKKGLIHFSSCSTLACDEKWIEKFLERSGFSGISGYGSDVRFSDSFVMESVFVNGVLSSIELQYPLAGVIEEIVSEFPKLIRSTGFRAFLNE